LALTGLSTHDDEGSFTIFTAPHLRSAIIILSDAFCQPPFGILLRISGGTRQIEVNDDVVCAELLYSTCHSCYVAPDASSRTR
jgi:hypothetical protein